MRYTDFHVHGNLKTFFTGYDVPDKESPWEKVSVWIDDRLFRENNRVLHSQASFQQLTDGDLQIAVMPLYSTERGFVRSFLLKFIDLFSKRISSRLFKAIRKNKKTYWEQLQDYYQHLLRAATDNKPGHENIIFTSCFEDIVPDKMNIVAAMEGAHCFLDTDEDVATPAGINKIIARIKKYKQRTGDPGFPRVFILNLTHLTYSPFSNHAYGMKMLNHDDFIPKGKGLSPAGMKIMESILGYDKDYYPIIIDIKHMSLQARKDYYEIRRAKYRAVPVIASHAGCTGISWDEIPDYITAIRSPLLNHKQCNIVSYKDKPRGILPGTEFNPWSINLYDEDIAEIFNSGGIIGISLDQRILGCGKIANEKMSKEETFPGVTPARPVFYYNPGEPKAIQDADLHFRHFCNTIFHIVKTAAKIENPDVPVDPWKQIVIGSDFDGMIDAVDFCINGRQYGNIEQYMVAKFAALAEEAGMNLPGDVATIITDLLYENGHRFLEKYYSRNEFPAA
ncbi:MAG: hypothetical protein H7Y01_07445 [Ferruginibacter sp.]|nr:hypothetical protein [Chitinophagaceae bacterium]